jgi:predicted nucleic acid-binding protein
MAYVLDACAMIAFLRGEPGAEVVEGLLIERPSRCHAHAINLCEVYYDFLRASDGPTALRAVQDLMTAGVLVREDLAPALWQAAGRFKARHRVSLADAFALALAEAEGAELVTSDHHEFDPLVATQPVRFRFIR